MTTARALTVPPDRPGVYHLVNRCVRRAFLCGEAYLHRREWVAELLRRCAPSFAVEVLGFAVMSNHYHLVLKCRPERAETWSAREVAERWSALYPRHDADGGSSVWDPAELDRRAADPAWVEVRRRRLAGISWLMKLVNETISRRANREDGCTGAFWEGRFKATALLDQAAVLAAMVYVDLNPIRAKLAETPEASAFTSVAERIRARQAASTRSGLGTATALAVGADEVGTWFAPLAACRLDEHAYAPSLDEYLDLVDATGRLIRAGKRGSIPAHLRPILERLQIDLDTWGVAMGSRSRLLGTAIGSSLARAAEAARRGVRWLVDKARIHRHEADSLLI